MQIFETITGLHSCLGSKAHTIGLVPTMGALHQGHLSLIDRAKNETDLVVCSIFVNPTQFNDPSDLKNYPRTLEEDLKKLIAAGCDVVFIPSVHEMYEVNKDTLTLDLGTLATGMEGASRPGHFAGVVTVVNKLFRIVQPDNSYFGEKDFQQLAIIKYLVKQTGIKTQIKGCAIVREPDGLAMSSRNALLSVEERKEAPLIFKILRQVPEMAKNHTVKEVQNWVLQSINTSSILMVDYFDVVDAETLIRVSEWQNAASVRACIAVKAGRIRLLDNIAIF